MLNEHNGILHNLPKIVDAALTALCWWASYYIRFQYFPGAERNLEFIFLKLTFLLIIVTIYSFGKSGLYLSQRFTSRSKEILTVVRANITAVTIFLVAIYFFADNRVSRLTLIFYFLISTVVFTIARLAIRNFFRYLRKQGKNLRHVLLVGNSSQINHYVATVRSYKDSGINFLGWIDAPDIKQDESIPTITQSYSEYRKDNLPEIIILAYEGETSHKANDFVRKYHNDIVPIQLLPDLTYSMVGHKIDDFGGIPLITFNNPPLSTLDLFLKRAIDLVLVTFGLVIISPLLFLLSLAVKLSSPGPIFFGQKRVGLDGKEFMMWKFRSMKVAPKLETQEWSNKENPRKTKVGDFLRKTSLDELPQLWNVLKGDMSLIGPRPEQSFFVEKFRNEIPGYMLKHKMKPGITGWAQVNGWRGDTDLTKRIECDIHYIKNWSLLLDIKIIFLTFWKGFINPNAY